MWVITRRRRRFGYPLEMVLARLFHLRCRAAKRDRLSRSCLIHKASLVGLEQGVGVFFPSRERFPVFGPGTIASTKLLPWSELCIRPRAFAPGLNGIGHRHHLFLRRLFGNEGQAQLGLLGPRQPL